MSESNAPHSVSMTDRFQALLRQGFQWLVALWETPGVGRATICSPVVGIIAGLGAVAFLVCLQGMYGVVLGGLLHFHMPPTLEGEPHAVTYPWPWWLVLLVPTVGGLISGVLVFTWAPEAEGHGTDAMIRAFHQGGGMIRSRVPFIKSVASIITIGTGGSAGQEGPIAQIGSGFGSYLARVLEASSQRAADPDARRSGRGRGRHLPGSAGRRLFAGEVLYSSTAFESAALLPCLASSIVAYSTFALFITPKPIFSLPPLTFPGPADLPLYVGLTLVCAVFGWLYVRVFYGMRDKLFNPMPIPRQLKPAVGGLLLGPWRLAYPAGDDRRIRLGAVGRDRHAAGTDADGRTELRSAHGDRPALHPLRAEDRGHGLHDQLGRQRRRVRAVDAHRRHDRRLLRTAHGLALPGGAHQPGGLRAGRHGRLLRRRLQDAAHLDRDGQRDDRLVQPARPLDAGLRAEHGHLPALDDLRGAGAQPDRQPGAPGRLRGRRARPDPGRRCRHPHGGHRADPRLDALQGADPARGPVDRDALPGRRRRGSA